MFTSTVSLNGRRRCRRSLVEVGERTRTTRTCSPTSNSRRGAQALAGLLLADAENPSTSARDSGVGRDVPDERGDAGRVPDDTRSRRRAPCKQQVAGKTFFCTTTLRPPLNSMTSSIGMTTRRSAPRRSSISRASQGLCFTCSQLRRCNDEPVAAVVGACHGALSRSSSLGRPDHTEELRVGEVDAPAGSTISTISMSPARRRRPDLRIRRRSRSRRYPLEC